MSLDKEKRPNPTRLSFSISRCYEDVVLDRRMNRNRTGTLKRDGSGQQDRACSNLLPEDNGPNVLI